jgi:hypothetical protein
VAKEGSLAATTCVGSAGVETFFVNSSKRVAAKAVVETTSHSVAKVWNREESINFMGMVLHDQFCNHATLLHIPQAGIGLTGFVARRAAKGPPKQLGGG